LRRLATSQKYRRAKRNQAKTKFTHKPKTLEMETAENFSLPNTP
jgi:hypothetical protein